jgi:hypothetical protein
MLTPPKDKPVFKDEDVSSEQDELQHDEEVADAPNTQSKSDSKDTESDSSDNSADLNIDSTDAGLNEEQGEEFL